MQQEYIYLIGMVIIFITVIAGLLVLNKKITNLNATEINDVKDAKDALNKLTVTTTGYINEAKDKFTQLINSFKVIDSGGDPTPYVILTYLTNFPQSYLVIEDKNGTWICVKCFIFNDQLLQVAFANVFQAGHPEFLGKTRSCKFAGLTKDNQGTWSDWY